MNAKSQKILTLIIALSGLALLLSVQFVFPACSGTVTTASGKEVPMRCHYTSVCMSYLAVLIFLTSVSAFITNQYQTACIMNIALTVLLFLSSGTKLGTGICADLTMPCHSMATAARAISLVVGVLSVILLLKSTDCKQKRKSASYQSILGE